jgi:hypothetical protein
MLGLCLVAIFALGTVAAAGSASAAEPEWGRCVAAKGGAYKNSSCTETAPVNKKTGKSTGKFEWNPGAPKAGECVKTKDGEYTNSTCTTKSAKPKKGKFEILSPQFKGEGGAGVLFANYVLCVHGNQNVNELCEETKGKESYSKGTITGISKIECTSENAEGELSGTKSVTNVHVVFHGCHYTSGIKCYNTAVEGEVQVSPLVGELGYISKAKKEVGVVLHPATAGGAFAEFECNHGALFVSVGAGPDKWTNRYGTTTEEPWYSGSGNDGIISPVVPVDKMTSKETQEYKITTRTEEPEAGVKVEIPENVPNRFEGGKLELLESWLGSSEVEPLKPEEERFAWGPAGEEVTNVNVGHGEIEIKA